MARQLHPTGAGAAPDSEVRTFLIADVRDWTRFTLESGDEAAARLATRFADVTEEVVCARGGRVVELRGDEAMAVFSSARQALRAALEMQDRFAREVEADPSLPLHVGIGLDAGEAVPVKGGYRGAALNLAARLQSVAQSGEVLASEGVVHLARKTEGLRYVERGLMSLKGFADPVRVIQVVSDAASPVDVEAPVVQRREAPLAQQGFVARVLGPFELLRHGVPVDTAAWQPRVRSLFLLIATAPGRRRLRDEVIDILWPESSADTGPSNLRYTLHMLRRALGNLDPSPVLFEQGWISLNPAYQWEIDFERFEELAGAPADDVNALEQAAALYRGEPLAENRYDDWAVPVREHAERTWRELCLKLGQVYMALGSHQQAGEWLERVLRADPLDEEAMQVLLVCMIESGRRSEALRRYQELERHLREELDVPPAPETTALIQGLKARTDEASQLPRAPVITPPHPRADIVPSYPLPAAGPLVGRDNELSTLVEAVARLGEQAFQREARGEQAQRLVLIAAEAGMGKTRLLGEVARRAREMDVLVLAGGCYEQEGRLAYGPIHDALADYVRAQPDVLLGQIKGQETELARIVPEIRVLTANDGEGSPRDVEGERMRLFLAVAQTLERISADTPLLLILDDLHWADDATLQLVHFLLRQPGLDGLLMLGAYRTDELTGEAPLQQLVRDGRNGGKVGTIDLGPLSPADLAGALAARLGGSCAPDLLGALQARSAGNPFFALQMAGLLQEEGRLERTEDGWRMVGDQSIELPPAVRETISRRLRHLTVTQREALTRGAVLGREFSYAPLERLWQGDEPTLFEALDVALDAHIVAETEDGYAFRHPLLWEVAYHRAPSARRAVLHERAALMLEELYGDQAEERAAELAHHFVSAGRVHIGRALHYLTAAGDQAERGYAHVEAAAYYRRALDLARPAGRASVVAETLERLGEVLKAMGRLEEALSVLEEAAEAYRQVSDLEGEGRVAALMGLVHYFRGSWEEGIARLEPVVKRLEQNGPSRSLALLYASLPRVYLPAGRRADGLVAAERAVELARQLDDERLIPDAVFVHGRALLESGRVQEAIPVLEESIRLAEALPDLFVLTAACFFVSQAYLALGNVAPARDLAERALKAAEERGGLEQMVGGLGQLTDLSFLLGDWETARAYAERQLSLVRSLGVQLRTGLRLQGTLALHTGAWEQASELLTQYAALAEQENRRRVLLGGSALLAELDLLRAEPRRALARLDPLLRPFDWHEYPDVLIPLAWAQLEAGNTSEARETIERAVSVARRELLVEPASDAGLIVDAWRVKGMILAREGDRREAEQSFAEAVNLGKTLPYPYGEARALCEWGRMLLEAGDVKHASPRLEEALAIFRRLGARPYVERTEQALETVGLRS